jgi:aminoglycoside phosphotransferase (APT) family kinase protein
MGRLAEKQCLCHGDPNPGNFIVRGDETIIIDWTNASIGNPEADLAEYIVMVRYAQLPDAGMNELLNGIREVIVAAFTEQYSQLSEITAEEIDAWILPIAARKLAADATTDGERVQLIAEIRRRLAG